MLKDTPEGLMMKWTPNPRGKEEYTLDGKIPIKHQKENHG